MKLSINPHFVAPGIGLAFSLPLLFTQSLPAIFAGGMGTTGASGYLAAQVVMLSDTRKRQEEITRKTRLLNLHIHPTSAGNHP